MISDNADHDQFISDHRWGVLTTLRRDGHPVSSVVAYARHEDTVVVSTPGGTFKRKSLDRDSRATLCIVTNSEPFNFVSIEGRVDVETTDLVANTRLVFQNISDSEYSEPEDLQGWLDAQNRVIIRLHPERVYGVIR
ncbi:MAG: TIGR03618 family F420-dependent PPOX class oxidoreductase [Pseudomonadales bacterium]|jgi:PPOX class probable F420-dependent enzyme